MMTEREQSFFVAIDGGGTKTVCVVADGSGAILGSGLGGAANVNFTTVELARCSLADAIGGAWRVAGSPTVPPRAAVLTGPVPNHIAAEVARAETGAADLHHPTEGLAAWHAALAFRESDCGVTIGAGTGAVAQGFNRQGERAQATAAGGLFGDEGSAYWIAIEGMRAVVRAEDGRDPPTRLREALFAMYEVSKLWDFVGLVYQKPLNRREIAAFAPLVSQVAADGDPKAQQILARAGGELAEAAAAVIRRLNLASEEFPLVPFGSVWKAGRWLTRPFREAILAAAPRAHIISPGYEPVVGTLLIALQRGGIALQEEVLAALDASVDAIPIPLRRSVPV